MAYLKDNYYLLNGDHFESSTIYVPYKGTYYKNVKDISDMDKATIDLDTDYREALQDCNPELKLGNQFYVAKYPYSQGVKIYKPIEIFTRDDKIDKVLNKFMEYVELRNFNYHKGNNLEISDKDKLVSFVYSIINSLSVDDKKNKMLGNTSIVGKDIKSNFQHNTYLFRRQIDYTQLRNIVITYLYIKAGKSIPTNRQIGNMIDFSNNIRNLYPLEPKEVAEALKEYKEKIISIKDEEEKKAVLEEFQKNTQERNVQMTLFDICPTDELAFLKKKKN